MTTTISDIHQGDSRTITVNVTNSSDSSVYDLTGCSLKLAARKLGSTTNAFSVDGTVTDASNGVATFELTATETDVDVGTYRYEIQVTDSSGNKYTAKTGEFNILEDLID